MAHDCRSGSDDVHYSWINKELLADALYFVQSNSATVFFNRIEDGWPAAEFGFGGAPLNSPLSIQNLPLFDVKSLEPGNHGVDPSDSPTWLRSWASSESIALVAGHGGCVRSDVLFREANARMKSEIRVAMGATTGQNSAV